MVSSLHRTNLLISWTYISFVVTMYYLVFLPSLDLLSNIQKLKSSISTDLMKCSIPCLSTSCQSEDPFSIPKTHGNIWGLSSTRSLCSTNMLTSTRTKQSLQSSIWDFSGTHHEKSTRLKNTSYTDAAFYPSLYMDSSYGSITKPYYHTL